MTPEFQKLTSGCRIDSVTRIESGTDIFTYEYNAADVLSKVSIRHSYQSYNYEAAIATFNSDGTIGAINVYDLFSNPDFLLQSYSYTYSNGKITTIVEQNNETQTPYSTVYTLTYDGDNLLSFVQTGDPDGENMKITDIVYENGNAKSMKFYMSGDGSVVANILPVFDDKFNHSKHMFPLPEQILELFNNNNLVSVEIVDQLATEFGTIAAGTKLIDREFTYNEEDEVLGYTSHPTLFDEESSGDRTYLFTYNCN